MDDHRQAGNFAGNYTQALATEFGAESPKTACRGYN